jgi:hypothetical protein
MREFHFNPPVVEIFRSACEKCGASMWLTRIEPDMADHDKRTFECKAWTHVMIEIVKYRRWRSRSN